MSESPRLMFSGLDWRDFEIMVDLLFSRGGWRRQSALAEGEVDIDLPLDNPVTREAAWVQVKSTARQAVLDDYGSASSATGARSTSSSSAVRLS
jgi:hypothetical protein